PSRADFARPFYGGKLDLPTAAGAPEQGGAGREALLGQIMGRWRRPGGRHCRWPRFVEAAVGPAAGKSPGPPSSQAECARPHGRPQPGRVVGPFVKAHFAHGWSPACVPGRRSAHCSCPTRPLLASPREGGGEECMDLPPPGRGEEKRVSPPSWSRVTLRM